VGLGLLVRPGQRLDLAAQAVAEVVDGLAAADEGAAIVDGHAALGTGRSGRRRAVPRSDVVRDAVLDPGEGVVLEAVLPASDGPRAGDVGNGHDAVVLVVFAGAGKVDLHREGGAAADGIDEGETGGVFGANVPEDRDARLGDEALAFGLAGAGIGLQVADDVAVGVLQGRIVNFDDPAVVFGGLALDGSGIVGGQEARRGGGDGHEGEEGGEELHVGNVFGLLGYFGLRRAAGGLIFTRNVELWHEIIVL